MGLGEKQHSTQHHCCGWTPPHLPHLGGTLGWGTVGEVGGQHVSPLLDAEDMTLPLLVIQLHGILCLLHKQPPSTTG